MAGGGAAGFFGAIACAEGCAYCCHLNVAVTILEAIAVADAVRASPEAAAHRSRIMAAAAALARSPAAPASGSCRVKVKAAGVLRQLSAIFDTRALGYQSALVAAQIDPARIDEAAATISEHPGVSHNYKRNHAYNLWYTLATPPGDDFDAHLDALHRASGATVTRKLPTLTLYKIGVKLDMTGRTAAELVGQSHGGLHAEATEVERARRWLAEAKP